VERNLNLNVSNVCQGMFPLRFIAFSEKLLLREIGFRMKNCLYLVVAAFTVAGSVSAYADDCSGRDHNTGTVVGAVGGAAIGGVASHNVGGAVVGGVLGALAGNAISRSEDCNRQTQYRQPDQHRDENRLGHNGSYHQGYRGQADENDYWGVESYADFGADYRHISEGIRRGREDGSLTAYEARRYEGQLQQIRSRADRQQRRGRFNPQEIEDRLTQLRAQMHVAREDGQGSNDQGYRR
jgi:hypothetical protein